MICFRSRQSILVAGFTFAYVARAAALSAQQTAAVERTEQNSQLLTRPITVELRSVSLKRAITDIAEKGRVRIFYQVELLDANTRPVTVSFTKVALGAVLDKVLEGTALRAVVSA